MKSIKHAWRRLALITVALSINTALADDNIDCSKAETTLDLNHCAGIALDASKAQLDKYFAAAKAEAVDFEHVPAMLDASQTVWLEYRKTYCASIYQYYIDGSIRSMMNLECEKRLTDERTHTLWQDYLVAMDGTEILPKPTN